MRGSFSSRLPLAYLESRQPAPTIHLCFLQHSGGKSFLLEAVTSSTRAYLSLQGWQTLCNHGESVRLLPLTQLRLVSLLTQATNTNPEGFDWFLHGQTHQLPTGQGFAFMFSGGRGEGSPAVQSHTNIALITCTSCSATMVHGQFAHVQQPAGYAASCNKGKG